MFVCCANFCFGVYVFSLYTMHVFTIKICMYYINCLVYAVQALLSLGVDGVACRIFKKIYKKMYIYEILMKKTLIYDHYSA